MKKRVYDLAGCTPKSVTIYLNGKKIDKVKDFESYVSLYFKSKNNNQESETPIIAYHKDPRWEICFAPSDSFQ